MRSLRCTIVAALLALLVAGCAGSKPSAQDRQGSPPSSSATTIPTREDTASVEWLKVNGPAGSVMTVAVARPHGAGPFPAVIILHGTHGFAQEYVQLAQDLAAKGVVGVAPCWFAGRRGAGTRFITPIECPDAPPLPDESDPDRFRFASASIAAVIEVAGKLPGVRSDNIALFGHSRGGGAALNYVLSGGTAGALVLNSTGYPSEVASIAHELNVPVLIMHGTADAPADGGSGVTAIERARAFEAALHRSGKVVEAKYYEGAGHNGIFTDRAQYHDAVERIAAFILTHSS